MSGIVSLFIGAPECRRLVAVVGFRPPVSLINQIPHEEIPGVSLIPYSCVVMARILAPASLAAAAALFFITWPFEATFAGGLLHAFAEAAMIGGLADWFAVVALFRHPFGIPIPHTAIILKYRRKLTAGIGDAVQNSWLKKETILERLKLWKPGRALLASLDDQVNKNALLSALRALFLEVVKTADPSRTAAVLLPVLQDRLNADSLLRAVRSAGERITAMGWHRKALTPLLSYVADRLSEQRTHELLAENLRKAMEEYAESGLRRVGRRIAEALNVLNYEDLAASILIAIREDLRDFAGDDAHPLRQDFERWVRDIIEGLPRNEAVIGFLENAQQEFFSSESTKETINVIIGGILSRLKEDLDREASWLMRHAADMLDAGLERLSGDERALDAMDAWKIERIARAVENMHGEIGEIVRHNLNRLDDAQLVEQIESRVGSDLQYIRVNGALVGGFVGMAIHLVKGML